MLECLLKNKFKKSHNSDVTHVESVVLPILALFSNFFVQPKYGSFVILFVQKRNVACDNKMPCYKNFTTEEPRLCLLCLYLSVVLPCSSVMLPVFSSVTGTLKGIF